MWGFQPILDASPLSQKLLNDQLEALWNKVMGGIDYRDLSGRMKQVVKSQEEGLSHAQSQIDVQADQIALKAERQAVDALSNQVSQQAAQLTVQAGQIESKVDSGQIASLIRQNADQVRIAVGQIGGNNQVRNGAPHFGERGWYFAYNSGPNVGVPVGMSREVFYLKPGPEWGSAWMESALFPLTVGMEYTISFNYSMSMYSGELGVLDAHIVYPAGVGGLNEKVERFVVKSVVQSPKRERISGMFTAEYPMAYLLISNANAHERAASIYDIAVQQGTTATAWVPNANEIKSSGITVDNDEITLDSHRLTILLRDNQDPETVSLRMSADDKGFDRLVVGELTAGNVPTRQMVPLQLYVGSSGNDSYDGCSTARAKRTLSAALNLVPPFLAAPVTIICQAGTHFQENIQIAGFSGGGSLSISPSGTWGSGTTRITGRVEIVGCSCPVALEGLSITSNVHPVLRVEASPGVLLDSLRVTGSNRGNQHGIGITGGSARIFNCIAEYCSTGIHCDGAMVHAYRCSGNNTGVAGSAGITARRCAVAVVTGTTPVGSGANTYTAEGGLILGSGTGTTSSGTPNAGTSTVLTLPGSMATYRNGQWRTDNNAANRAIQGDYTGDGLNLGCLFFPGLQGMLAGKTIHSARIFLRRKNGGGYSAERPVYLGLTTVASANGVPQPVGNAALGQLSWGQAQWITVPSAILQVMANTSLYQALCIYTTQNPKQNYVILEGEPQLEITYS